MSLFQATFEGWMEVMSDAVDVTEVSASNQHFFDKWHQEQQHLTPTSNTSDSDDVVISDHERLTVDSESTNATCNLLQLLSNPFLCRLMKLFIFRAKWLLWTEPSPCTTLSKQVPTHTPHSEKRCKFSSAAEIVFLFNSPPPHSPFPTSLSPSLPNSKCVAVYVEFNCGHFKV